ncbi:MAG TPA: CDP-diacylglycerol diphosphatase, partial [Methylocella sp.]|nr:CDP-diacylglycerol diphosphatase [Methylocella sp.]
MVSRRAQKELPRDAINMAINTAGSRSQDQLHIHIDCIRPDVRKALLGRIDWSHILASPHRREIETEPAKFCAIGENRKSVNHHHVMPKRDHGIARKLNPAIRKKVSSEPLRISARRRGAGDAGSHAPSSIWRGPDGSQR